MKTSVIICTKNRVEEPIECVRSVVSQSVPPDELIIVYGGTEEVYLRIKEEFPRDSRFKYIRSTCHSCLSVDRNLGVRYSSGDIIIFLDDDTVLDKDFIKEIVKTFESDTSKKVGGVMGDIVNLERPETILRKLHANLHLIIARVFLLPSFGDGRFRASSAPTFIHGAREIKDIEVLSGCDMAFRRDVFKGFQFDEDFPDLYTDDDDFSYRVSRKYRNVYTPYAKLSHVKSPIASGSARGTRSYERAKTTVMSNYYLLEKNFPHTLAHTLAFWWSVIGSLVQAIMIRDIERIRGVVVGTSNLKNISRRMTSNRTRQNRNIQRSDSTRVQCF
jgi:GT2 family glycosyltransferase